MQNANQNLSLQLTHVFPGTRERVFQAWTSKAELEQWFGPEGMRTTVEELEVRVGGAYVIRMQAPEGQSGVVSGKYVEIVLNEKLVFTWRWSDWAAEQEDTLVTVEFIEKGEVTEVVLTHQHLADENAVQHHHFGWTSTLEGNLHKYLA